MKTIKIGNASVPLADYAIGAAAVLGIRDSGKTVTSKGLAEQLIDSGVRQLKALGLVAVDGNRVVLTKAGNDAAVEGGFEPLPTGDALRDFWRSKLDGGELKIFGVLEDAYPTGMTKQQIAEATGYKSTSVYEFCRKLIARKIVVTTFGGLTLSTKLYEK